MNKLLVMFMMIVLAAHAAIDQSYDQVLKRDGTSSITKAMDVSIFSAQLDEDALARLADYCQTSQLQCAVDGKNIVITLAFSSGGYYTFSTDYGIFTIEHTLTIKRIPTDRFSSSLDDLLESADVLESTGDSADSIDLLDKEGNKESVYYLRKFGATLGYTLEMPADIYEASAGSVAAEKDGRKAVFDLISVMEEGQPVVVRSSELNSANIIILSAIVVLGGLAYSFYRERKAKSKKQRKR